jgi:hypothetical protein
MFSKSLDLGDELFSKLDYCISVTSVLFGGEYGYANIHLLICPESLFRCKETRIIHRKTHSASLYGGFHWSDSRWFEHPVPHHVQSASIHAPSLPGRLYHYPGWQHIGASILRRDLSTL